MKSLLALSILALSLTAFAADPIPPTGEFGGLCATGLTLGKEVKTDCKINWVDAVTSKTYCFSNEAMKTKWAKDTKTHIIKADAEYAKLTAAKAMMDTKKHAVQKANDKVNEAASKM